MLACRKPSILLSVVLIVLVASIGFAQGETREATVGVLGIDDKYSSVSFVDLSMRDPETNSPHLYRMRCIECPFEIGRTYKAKVKYSRIASILVNGAELTVGFSVFAAADKRVINFTPEKCPEHRASGGGHWEWDPSSKRAVCKAGAKDNIKWKAAKGSKQERAKANESKNIPPCKDQPGFANKTLTVVITVKPDSDMHWKFPEAPSVVAERILSDLNANTRNITFKEASGTLPNLYVNVTMSETNEGTRQDSARVEVTGLGKVGTLFTEKSGEAPYTNWQDAVDNLSKNMLNWLENGWSTKPPCLQPNGTLRSK
jgi:hypothetical protein